MLSTEEIKKLMDLDASGPVKMNGRIGRKYYEGEHDILNYRLYYYNADGELVEDKTRSNIKVCHPFFTELVDQCVQYMLSGKDSFVCSDNADLQKELDLYFGDDFRSEFADMLTDVCACGFGNMYAYRNENERISFQYADALGVIEVREKDADDHTAYVIYWYIDRVEKGQKTIKRIQVWDAQQTTYFVQVNGGDIETDDSVPINPRAHVLYSKDGDNSLYYDGFGFIPFFRLDANRRRISHLQAIKGIIDDYDLMACGLSNNLQDVTEAVYVVKGFQGSDLNELIQNVRTKKVIGTAPDGGIDIKTVDLPYDARIQKLELDEKNIYRFGMGFNSAQIGDGNVTNVVIRSRYALLDLKCNKLENRIKAFLKKLCKIVLQEINDLNETDYSLSDIYFDFRREIMTNATDNAAIEKTEAETQQIRLNTILNAAARLDDETVLRAVCDLFELDYDEVRDAVEKNPKTDLNAASEVLANTLIDDAAGGDGGE